MTFDSSFDVTFEAGVSAFFRRAMRSITPSWLRGSVGDRVTQSIALECDRMSDRVVESVKRRFPGLQSDDSLSLIGQERRIRRGPSEASATYAARLRRWLDDHATRGGPYALLQQIGAYYAAAPFAVELLYYVGTRFSLDTAGSIARDAVTWSPYVQTTPQWEARWWLMYHWPTPITGDGIWTDPGTWNDGGVWDSSLTVAQVDEIRTVPTEWNAAHTAGTIVLLPSGAELWDYPQGTWNDPGTWGSSGVAQVGIT